MWKVNNDTIVTTNNSINNLLHRTVMAIMDVFLPYDQDILYSEDIYQQFITLRTFYSLNYVLFIRVYYLCKVHWQTGWHDISSGSDSLIKKCFEQKFIDIKWRICSYKKNIWKYLFWMQKKSYFVFFSSTIYYYCHILILHQRGIQSYNTTYYFSYLILR